MSGLAEALGFLVGLFLCGEARVLRDDLRDRCLKAPVQRMKFLDGDRGVLLERDLRNGLAADRAANRWHHRSRPRGNNHD